MKNSFRELKARKRKFGFESNSMYKPEHILYVAEAIKTAQWMDKEALFDYKTDMGRSEFRIYTDFEPLAEELRIKFC